MRNPSVLFAKVLGSGFEGGFGVRPSWDRQGLFLVFDGRDAAQRCLQDHPLFSRMRERASELLVAQLEPIAMRGQWAGHTLPYFAQPPSTVQPIVAITRASIRARGAARFWSRAPQAQASLEAADGCWLAAGLGEAPLLRQMTFSIWDSEAHMRTFARQGAHQQAIQAAATEGHFSESMFARYRLISLEGQWNGKHWSYSGGAAQPLHSAHAI